MGILKGIVVGMEEVKMHNVTKQIIVGVAIAVISASAIGVKTLYDEVKLNTQFRVESINVVDDI